jgi:hypothetical protein
LLSVLPTLYHQIGTTERKGKLVTISEGSIKYLKGKKEVLDRTDICLQCSFFLLLLLLLLLVVPVVGGDGGGTFLQNTGKKVSQITQQRVPEACKLENTHFDVCALQEL